MPEAPANWLDETEMAAWLALIGVVVKLPGALDRQLQRDSGVSHFEYMVLIGLSEAPGRTLRMSALAEFTDAQLPRLSQVAGRLESRGLLTRCPDPTDGRATWPRSAPRAWRWSSPPRPATPPRCAAWSSTG